MKSPAKGSSQKASAPAAKEAVSEKPSAPLGPPSRERLVAIMGQILAAKGPNPDLERRASAGEGLTVKGIHFDADVIREALLKQGLASTSLPAGSMGMSPQKPWKPEPLMPAVTSTGVVRWQPQLSSAASLAATAVLECEEAEPFIRSVTVSGENKVALLARPAIFAKPTGEYLWPGENAEVIARVVSKKDGRVYLRLKAKTGWVSTRSRKDFSKVVLAGLGSGVVLLEPLDHADYLESRAVHLLDHVDELGKPLQPAAGQLEISNLSANSSVDVPGIPPANAGAAQLRGPKKFRAVYGRSQILSEPAGASSSGAMIQSGDAFLADAVCFRVSEHRAYLRLADGRGWVCERSRADFRRNAVEPEDSAARMNAKASAKRLKADGGGKVIVINRDTDGADGGDGLEDAKGKAAREAYAAARARLRSTPAIFRSDEELWPQALMPVQPIVATLRVRLRRLFCFHGRRVLESERDIKEANRRADSMGKAAAAGKALRDLADKLQKEVSKAKDDWADAVRKELKTDGITVGKAAASAKAAKVTVAESSASDGIVAAAQVGGERWYCASVRADLATVGEQDDDGGADKPLGRRGSKRRLSSAGASGSLEEGAGDAGVGGSSGAGERRHLGPLRQTAEEAACDLRRLRQHLSGETVEPAVENTSTSSKLVATLTAAGAEAPSTEAVHGDDDDEEVLDVE